MAAQNSPSGGYARRRSVRVPAPRPTFESDEALAPARDTHVAAPKRRPSNQLRRSGERNRRPLPVPKNSVLKYVVKLRKMNQMDPLRHLAVLQIMREQDSGLEDKILRLTKLLLPRHKEFFRDLDGILPEVPRAPYPLVPKLGSWKGGSGLRKLVRGMDDRDKALVQMWLWRFGKGGGVFGFVGRVRKRVSDKKWWKWINQIAWCAKNRANVGDVWRRVGRYIGKKGRRELAALLRFEKSLGKQAGKAWMLARYEEPETDFWESYTNEHPAQNFPGIALDKKEPTTEEIQPAARGADAGDGAANHEDIWTESNQLGEHETRQFINTTAEEIEPPARSADAGGGPTSQNDIQPRSEQLGEHETREIMSTTAEEIQPPARSADAGGGLTSQNDIQPRSEPQGEHETREIMNTTAEEIQPATRNAGPEDGTTVQKDVWTESENCGRRETQQVMNTTAEEIQPAG